MPRLQVFCLPSVQVAVDGRPVTAFRSVNERALLVYLAVEHDRPHPRETLAGLLWPDAPETVARRNLNQTLLNLRAALGDRDAARPLVLATRQTIQLNPAADIWVDVVAIAAHLAVAEAHLHPDAAGCAACMERLREAVGHYRGSFLREFARVGSVLFEEWALLKREWLERRIIAALGQLADYELECGEGALAERYARRALELDPLHEAAHRRLMRILAASGQRSAALLHYSTCQRLLAAELGVEPDVETRALY